MEADESMSASFEDTTIQDHPAEELPAEEPHDETLPAEKPRKKRAPRLPRQSELDVAHEVFDSPLKNRLIGACIVAGDKMSFRDIYNKLGISDRTARRWRWEWEHYKDNGRPPRKKTGRPITISDEHIGQMVAYIHDGHNDRATSWKVLRDKFTPHVKVWQTVRTAMNKAGYHKCRACGGFKACADGCKHQGEEGCSHICQPSSEQPNLLPTSQDDAMLLHQLSQA